MTRPVPSLGLGHEAVVPAPSSGVQLGVGEDGPVSLRLFRLLGTRIAVAGLAEAAQLIAIRVCSAGTPVQVVTARPEQWEPLLRHNTASRVVTDPAQVSVPDGPSLLVHDRPEPAAPADRRPWQCVVTVRTQWGTDDLASFGYNDLAVFGSVPVQLVSGVATVFSIPRQAADRLAHVPPGSVAILRRGRLAVLGLNPTGPEYRLIESVRNAAPVSPTPIWRS